MNTFRINKNLLGTLLLALTLTACTSSPIAEKPPVVDKSSTQTSTPEKMAEPSADTSAIKEVAIDGNAGSNMLNPLNDSNNILSKRAIYFDYDSDVVKSEFRPMLAAHAKYLLANNGAKVSLVGNTDERGTREYNLALGQRRSVAVKKTLNLLGVSDNQIETVSYGKEKANQTCADDACYNLDRRADINYTSEK